MSLATTYCRAGVGIDAPLVTLETHLANGLPSFNLVGLPEKSLQESRDRVRSAIVNAGYEFPTRRITVNLAPADLPKQGARFDLAIAIGILIASKQLNTQLHSIELIGELTLSGQLRPVNGVLPAVIAAAHEGHSIIVPQGNANEAGIVENIKAYAADSLLDVCQHLSKHQALPLITNDAPLAVGDYAYDLRHVKGQSQARRALEVAAAGQHNLLMMGPPGSGKSMLAACLPSILPPLQVRDALQTAAIHSISQQHFPDDWQQRPFRSPHHTCSSAAMIGGGSQPRPGEISLANNGVLFLDEFPEFNRNVLEAMREPLETHQVHISRAAHQATFPARFQLIAAMNPCKCGYANDQKKRCDQCTPAATAKYQQKISGPLRDRIDIQIEVPAVETQELISSKEVGESSELVRARVVNAWEVQVARQGCANALLSNPDIESVCHLDATQQNLLAKAIDQLGLSTRAYHRILKVARTIADLDHSQQIHTSHLTEAIGYRRLDTTAT